MSVTRRTVAALVAVISAVAAGALPPAPPSATPLPAFGARIEVALGNVDVLVADRKGTPIEDLKREEFVLLVDGQRRDITNFARSAPRRTPTRGPTASVAGTETPPTPTADAAAAPVQPRLLAFYIDADNITSGNRNAVLKRAGTFVREHLVAPDRAAVVVHAGGLRVACPPTSDVDAVVRALVVEMHASTGGNALRAQRRMAEDMIRDCAQNRGCADPVNSTKLIARNLAGQLEKAVDLAIKSLDSFIHRLAGLPGRKTVIYISDGLPLQPGAETFWLITELLPVRIAETGYMEHDRSARFEELGRSAAAAGITLCTMDARGLDVQSGSEAENQFAIRADIRRLELQNYQDPLIFMARATGGMAVVNQNDFGKAFGRVGAALDASYSLGFHLDGDGDAVHDVNVEVPGRPDLRVIYRPTFVQRSRAKRIEDRVVAGLSFDIAENPLAVTLAAGPPVPTSGKRWSVPLEVAVPRQGLVLLPDGDALAASLELLFVASEASGGRSSVERRRQTFRVGAASPSSDLTISTSAEVAGGAFTISIGIVDLVTGEAGYAAVHGLAGDR